ncbi:hypothetical protein DSO57_1033074 [Entomophthora muscae]|uniref:Uncharacterized protein n=1 Tax=Entomophthora muscae TaxID=34485 RepID=A0ACC2U9N6_9FUNG|nr:hypothetical protein DSO57_1033074 [Entomophthora muscae]
METPTTAETMTTQLFGVIYITLMGMVDTMLAPILWWALPSGLAVFCPKPTNASTYAWLPDTTHHLTLTVAPSLNSPMDTHQKRSCVIADTID